MKRTWISDDNGNRCSVEYWGSEEAAKVALASLRDCSRCSDCSGCSRCSSCSRCSGCSGCSGCSRCSRCSGCSGCSDCSGCSGCSRCSRCSDVTGKNPLGDGVPIIPVVEYLHARIYEASSRPKSLNMSDWHTCANTHCRAGWVVTLAGEAGKVLEAYYDTPLAAMMIYDASCPDFKINPCRFFDSNEDALADMKKLADGTI